MTKKVRALFIVIAIFSLTLGCVPFAGKAERPPAKENEFSAELEYLLNDPNLQNALVGIYIESLTNGHVKYHHNEHRLFVPASNMKLFTTAASLVNLGPHYRFRTGIYYDGQITGQTLSGDLIVKGSGDPTISGRFYQDDIYAVFRAWADSLKKHGIKRIEGDLVGDNSYFTGATMAEGWNWDDETFWYSAHTSALSFNDNCVNIRVTGGQKIGDPVQLQIEPDLPCVTIVNTARTVDDSVSTLNFRRSRGGNTILVYGNFPIHKGSTQESITVEDPAQMFLYVLKTVLNSNGVEVAGNLKVIEQRKYNYLQLHRLFEHTSPEMKDIIRVVNKRSHNFYADQLLKTLGATFNGEGSFEAGSEMVSNWLHSIGVAPNEFIMVDGSGLSRKNFVAPNATATLLRWMFRSPYYEDFFNSLSISGTDGTMEDRMKGMLAQGRVHAKTGYVKHMRSLSGYAFNKDDRPFLFVLMVNNFSVPVSYVNLLQDRICELIVRY